MAPDAVSGRSRVDFCSAQEIFFTSGATEPHSQRLERRRLLGKPLTCSGNMKNPSSTPFGGLLYSSCKGGPKADLQLGWPVRHSVHCPKVRLTVPRSNNMAVKGVADFYEGSGKKHIVTTQTESAPGCLHGACANLGLSRKKEKGKPK